ncbi:MAG: TonB-dependent receptor [Proteobacteria bacterium]|nr:TonB-dependent receptor [Pseudomonadota bacterium]
MMLRNGTARAALVMFVFCATASAQDNGQFADSGSVIAPTREWVTTPGWGGPEDALTLPLTVSTVSRSEFDRREVQNLQEGIRRQPGVGGATVEELPSWWNPGFSLRGIGGPRVAVFSGGVPQRTSGLEVGEGGNLSLYDPFSVERVEIIRGNQAARYGGTASGGAISIIPRAPTERDSFGSAMRGRSAFDGSVSAMRHSALLDGGGQDLAGIVGGSWVGSEKPVTPGDGADDPGSFRTASGWFGSRVRLSGGTTLQVRGDLNHSSDIARARGSEAAPSQEPVKVDSQMPRYQRSLLNALIETRDLSSDIDVVRSSIAWQQVARAAALVRSLASQSAEQYRTEDTVDSITWNSSVVVARGDHRFMFGYELGYEGSVLDSSYSEATSGGTTAMRRLDAAQYQSALFAEDRATFGRWEISPGARVEYITATDRGDSEELHDLGVQGALTTSYHFGETGLLYLTGASGYRNPTLSERFYRGDLIGATDRSQLHGTSGLSGERSNSAELGVKQSDRNYVVTLAGFYTRFENYLGARLSDAREPKQWLYQNLSGVSLTGFEAKGSYRIGDEFELFGALAQSWSDNSRSIALPALTATYGLRYVQELCECTALKQFTGELYSRSVGDSIDRTQSAPNSGFPSGEGFATLNFEGAVDFAPLPLGDLSVLFGVRNIANTRYKEPFFSREQPGLTGYATLSLRY